MTGSKKPRINVIVRTSGQARAPRGRRRGPRTFYHWRIETSHFTFDAYGETEADARGAMADGWRIHQQQTGARYTFKDIADGGGPRQVVCGVPYRDQSRC